MVYSWWGLEGEIVLKDLKWQPFAWVRGVFGWARVLMCQMVDQGSDLTSRTMRFEQDEDASGDRAGGGLFYPVLQ